MKYCWQRYLEQQ